MSAAVPLGPCSFKMDSGSHPLWYNCDPPAPFLFFCSVQRNRETDLVSGPGGEIGLPLYGTADAKDLITCLTFIDSVVYKNLI